MAKKSPLIVLFTTVLIDLVGFGMVIPLVSVYGKHFGASALELGILGASYSLMQFFFAPIWGGLSDRYGRRPILLVSLAGSTLAYLGFGLANSFAVLLTTRIFAGIFAANISAAQAYIADVTTPADRARGMGLLGAAFGIGFTLGPPLGGIASAKLGLGAPGLIAAAICGLNFLLAIVRLPESLSNENRAQVLKLRNRLPSLPEWRQMIQERPTLVLFIFSFFAWTFAFSMMEQTFALLVQSLFNFEVQEAAMKTGLLLMSAGLLGAVIQGGMIRKLVPRWGENRLMIVGLALNAVSLLALPLSPSYGMTYLFLIPLGLGSALLNPCLSAMISKNADASRQGSTMGLSQGFASLARAFGPFVGLWVFAWNAALPYWIAAAIAGGLLFILLGSQKRARDTA